MATPDTNTGPLPPPAEDQGFRRSILEDQHHHDLEAGDLEGDNSDDVSLSSHSRSKKDQQADATTFTSRIFLSKAAVILVLLASATAASIGTYKFTSKQEANEFEHQFVNQADEIIKVSSGTFSSSLSALQSFSNAVTSVSLIGEQADWPLISVPHFEVRGRDFMASTRAQAIAIAPLVADTERMEWETYSVARAHNMSVAPAAIHPNIWKDAFRGDQAKVRDPSSGPYLPLSQIYPSDDDRVNFNLLARETFLNLIEAAISTRKGVISEVLQNEALFGMNASGYVDSSPKSIVLQPIYRDFELDSDIVAFVAAVLSWNTFFERALYEDAHPVTSVLKSHCQGQGEQAFTFQIDGQQVVFMGADDLHHQGFDRYETMSELGGGQLANYCTYSLHVYPSSEMKDRIHTATPVTMTMVVLLIFAFTSFVFIVYDSIVQRRNRQVVQAANQTNKIIHNLFPRQVHDRLFNADASNGNASNASSTRRRRRRTGKRNFRYQPVKGKLLNFLSDESKTASDSSEESTRQGGDNPLQAAKPIADLFPAATVMFCDIAGFTAWSSVRQPTEVFTLLENVYNSFDGIAKRRKVFKVETIGDSYLAVAGLPTPRKDHATVMVRFASDCMTQFDCLCQELETELGPGTSELSMRFGLHSGPVTAGVLRGEKTRFQLFGDTVNTASRMESTGQRGKIQVSSATANLLNEAHKGHWCTRREEPVQAKGKGEMITYWVNPKTSAPGSSHVSRTSLLVPQSPAEAKASDRIEVAAVDGSDEQADSNQERHPESEIDSPNDAEVANVENAVCPKLQRSISFISGVLLALLRQIVARRLAMGRKTIGQTQATRQARMAMQPEPGTLVLDEMEEIIGIPKFDAKAARRFVDPETVELPTEVVDQLHSFVTVVALMYQDNPFHNFQHATHVTMSVSKLLSRIVSPEDLDGEDNDWNSKKMHDHSLGITDDPITQFAVVFSAMIHDVDHPGVPNSVLVNNETEIAQHYRNKSVAEQNSVDVAWDLLMDDAYADLCACIFTNESELGRFRQLVVNTVLATDIADSELNSLRRERWNKAFNTQSLEAAPQPGRAQFVSVADDRNRKATIVIEHLIQASDVSHTMQHWEVYISWNEKLFEEMYSAYLSGHLDKDPSKRWYEGELGFYDYYIIPLAKKLKECGVFGCCSTEYLSYAIQNRDEWELKGRRIVDGYLRKYRPVKEGHFKDDLGEERHSRQQNLDACGSADDATSKSISSGSTTRATSNHRAISSGSATPTRATSNHSGRAARPVDQLFNASYHQRSVVSPLD